MKVIQYQDPKEIRNNKIVALARQGKTYEEIGEEFGLTRSMISHIAISNGVVRRPEDISVKKWKHKRGPNR